MALTMTDLVRRVTEMLRADLAVTVEEYYRIDPPPTAQTVYVMQDDEPAEEALGIGNTWADTVRCKVIAEVPWDDSVTTARALNATVETIKALPDDHRDLYDTDGVTLLGTRGCIQGVRWPFGERLGSRVMVLAAVVTIEYRSA